MIRIATPPDIPKILQLTKACAQFMVANNIYQWNEYYPSKQAFEQDLERNELWVVENDSHIIGCIVISNLMDTEYEPISWLTKNIQNIYIHRLAVHPSFQGMGLAKKLMDFAENYAREHHAASIRLDTFSQNKRNIKFYEARGYTRLGNIYFPKQSEHPFYCYELPLA